MAWELYQENLKFKNVLHSDFDMMSVEDVIDRGGESLLCTEEV